MREWPVPVSRKSVACFWAIVAFIALMVLPALPAEPALAAAAALGEETPLQDAPLADAAVVTWLPAGTVVSIEGPPVDGYYPVTAWDLSGWVRGATLLFASDVAADSGAGAVTTGTGEIAAGDQPPGAATDTAATDGAAAGMAPEADAAATPMPLTAADETTPADAEAAAPASDAADPAVPFPDAGPTGPASVTAKTPILVGPGPEFGLIVMAPAGSTVEQTGHLIDGYVTVQYAGVTGWAPLDHLGPLMPGTAATPAEPARKRGDAK